jgi:hypothetical protein
VSTLETYYGVHGNITLRIPGQTGAGHPADEESDEESGEGDADWIDVDGTEEAIAEANLNMHAEPVHIPSGFGMLSDEWDTGFYPTSQVIPSVVFESPVSGLEKDCNWTGPRPEKDRTAVLVFDI